MTDIMLVQVRNGRENLPHDNSSLRLCQKLLFNNQIEKLTTFTYLCYQVDGFFSLVDFVEFDDVGMVEDFEDLDLRGEDLLVDDVLFWDGLDGAALAYSCDEEVPVTLCWARKTTP